jgi:hypothetical protein
MKKVWSLAVVCLALLSGAHAQESFGLANSATGTTLNTLTKVVVNGGVPQAQIVATTDTSGAVGITTLGNGTSGTAIVTRSGIAPCVFDNTTVAGDFVQIAAGTAGNCHDVGATRPTSGQIIGVVIQTGGSAGTYNVLLDKSIFPSSSATAPVCNVLGSSDTISAAGTFATTCSISGLVQGSFLEIRAHGVLTTTATASPTEAISVNAGGTTSICTHTGNNLPATNETNSPWDIVCYVHILTTGAPGTATTWGRDTTTSASSAGGAELARIYIQNAVSQSFTTNSAQTVSISLTSTPVTGQSFTLQELIVRNY